VSAKRKRKAKRSGVIRRALGRWAWRQVTNWAETQRSRIRKLTKPKVVHASAKRRAWELQYPDPRRKPPPLTETIERKDEWMAAFEVELDNGWTVPFEVDIYEPRRRPLRELAYDAAVRAHGEITRSRTIVDLRPMNDLADELLIKEDK
jgi:hypothetical protein